MLKKGTLVTVIGWAQPEATDEQTDFDAHMVGAGTGSREGVDFIWIQGTFYPAHYVVRQSISEVKWNRWVEAGKKVGLTLNRADR